MRTREYASLVVNLPCSLVAEIKSFAAYYGVATSVIVEHAIACWLDRQCGRKEVPFERWIRDAEPVAGFVYLIGSDAGLFKIGMSRCPTSRLQQLKQTVPFKLHLIHTVQVKSARYGEAQCHRMFRERRERGEWFRLTAEDVDRFKTLTSEELCGAPMTSLFG